MALLRYKLWRDLDNPKRLCLKILEQAQICNRGEFEDAETIRFTSSHGFDIASCCVTDISMSPTLWLQGYDDAGLTKTETRLFPSEERLLFYVSQMQAALDEWENHGGFLGCLESMSDDDEEWCYACDPDKTVALTEPKFGEFVLEMGIEYQI